MTNDQLHEDAVKLLLQRQRNATETTAKGCVKSYNQRRREATAALQPILKAIWYALARGESVGGFTSKEDWASSQSITIRQIQRIIVGTPQKRHDVVLKVDMTVIVDGAKVVLTQALIDLLVPKKKAINKVVKSAAILHAKKTGWGNDGTLCGAELTFHNGITGQSDQFNNVGTGKSVNCPKCLERRAAKSKKAAETRATTKSLQASGMLDKLTDMLDEKAEAAGV